jgi:hypothetical protein
MERAAPRLDRRGRPEAHRNRAGEAPAVEARLGGVRAADRQGQRQRGPAVEGARRGREHRPASGPAFRARPDRRELAVT